MTAAPGSPTTATLRESGLRQGLQSHACAVPTAVRPGRLRAAHAATGSPGLLEAGLSTTHSAGPDVEPQHGPGWQGGRPRTSMESTRA